MTRKRKSANAKQPMLPVGEPAALPKEDNYPGAMPNKPISTAASGNRRSKGRNPRRGAGDPPTSSGSNVDNARSNAAILFGSRPDPWQDYKYSTGESFSVGAAGGVRFKEMMIGPGAIKGKGELYIFSGKYDFFSSSAINPALPDNLRFLGAYMFLKFQNMTSLARMLKKPINTALSISIAPSDLQQWLINYCTARHCARLLQALIVTPTNLSAKLADITNRAANVIAQVEALMDRLAGIPVPPWFASWVDNCMSGLFAYDTDSPIIMIDPTGVPGNNLWDSNAQIDASLQTLLTTANTSIANIAPTNNILSYIQEIFMAMYGLTPIVATGIHMNKTSFEMWRTTAVNIDVAPNLRFQGPVVTSPPNDDGMAPILIDRDSWKDGTNESEVYTSLMRNNLFYLDSSTPGSSPCAFTFSDAVSPAGLQNVGFPVSVFPSFTLPTTLAALQNGALWRYGDILPWLDLVTATNGGAGNITDYRDYNGPFAEYSVVEANINSIADATQVIIDRAFGTGLILS